MTTSAFCAHGARFSLWLALLACTKPLAVPGSSPPPAAPVAGVAVVPGVSRELADDRARRISRLGYQLALAVPPQKTEPIAASEVIRFHLSDASQPVQLDFKEQADHLKSVAVNGKAVAIDFRAEHLVLPAASLKPGANEVEISFVAGNQSLNRNDDYLYTLLVPDRARTVFPVFDQPNLKASFTLSLTLPKTWQALANGPLQDSTGAAASKTYRFAPSDTISTYLFSFAAGEFTRVSRTMAGRQMQFLHRETDKHKLKLSLGPIFRIHADALQFLEQYTGIPYPFRKFDFVALPDFQYGGMEHVGAIDYKASTLFLDEGATQDQKIARSNLISHETAHMWFGDLVTMQWFNDVWMKEVFANFMADKITQVAVAGSNYDLKFVVDHYSAAYGVDRTAGANPIRQELDNLQDAGSLYGNIIYHKAPIMMRQLELLMGEEPFRQGLQEYLRKYAYGNATWPDLIAILDARTPADLQAWNQVWVNQPGRPVFSYRRGGHDGQTILEITQQAEDGSARLWPQEFTVLLEFEDGRTQERTVKMTEREETLKVSGNPRRIVFNSTGIGYGVFPVAVPSAAELASLQSPVTRAAAYVNLYENMLNGRTLAPRQLLDLYRRVLPQEPEELNIKLLTGQTTDIFWKLLTPAQRLVLAPALEKELWAAMQQNPAPNSRKLLFKAYQSVALTTEAQTRLYSIWRKQQAPAGIKLTEDDYTALALALAVRDYPAAQPILPAQLARILNPDRQKRLQFLLPALAPDVATRDAFFASLKDEKNREKEAWVVSALGYLHHPLRAATSEKYLPASLALLEEIQQTGDIFFPYSWLQATLGSCQTPTAARTVREFLAAHPQYNPKLRAKLLQAADDLFRAEKLVK
ncbi:M1 family aminopeptidase [Hymenobacter psychrotolerans]|uniref:Aminopeptidase N n=1 Tax=Hymenobacter psychrotolerans DSM 18569 TaxID=1121959 RepID=A0A1M7FA12_9BACT|nr:M1 family aminopeptidase [Hymenobacter psychrotolerans]SHM00866.1 aminopeptidase N [Hymenobacter psychrotolerans DSM 18569]